MSLHPRVAVRLVITAIILFFAWLLIGPGHGFAVPGRTGVSVLALAVMGWYILDLWRTPR